MTENGIDMPLVSVENAGGIRGGVFGGTATLGELVTAFPYSNTVQMKAVTPAILYAMMEVSGVCLDGQDEETGMLLQTNNSGGFLQIGGFTVVYDATRPAGEGHVLSITLDGETQPLDREDDTRKIMLASNNYILGGGSDYTMLADLPKEAELGGELEAVQDYLEACIADGSIADYARPQGRIVMRGGYTPAEYTARIRILDGDSPAAAGTQVTYIADGGRPGGYHKLSSGLGFVVSYDTRDVPSNAYSGLYLDVRGMAYAKMFGSDNNFYQAELDYRQYWSPGRRRVLAWTVQSTNMFGDVPLMKYALTGTPFDLRGYYMGQFRDKSAHLALAEWRQMINTDRTTWVKRMLHHVGYAVWGGAGFMGPRPTRVEGVLPNLGVGLRIEIQPRMNLRLDFGRDMVNRQNLFYLNMTEAF